MVVQILMAVVLIFILAGLLYWLLVITEGVYLGRRAVVWMYDLTAHKYDGIKEFDDDAERFFVARPLRHHLRHLPVPLVLDVATGTGRLPHYLLDSATFHGRVIGLDPSSKMLALAAAKLAPFGYRTPLVQQTAVPLPFPDDCFDAVTCLESLEFFPSDAAALAEMVRVLQPGGVLMVTRRRGWEAKAFVGRYRNRTQFEALLTSFGLIEVNTQPWQVDYDQIFGRKPPAPTRS
jgi:ubiquinone/menaquinone biosynthesis C-methylase UbiE